MPDITMCTNDDCPLAKQCYRHEATASDWQSIQKFTPNEQGGCDFFMEIYNDRH